MFLGGDVLYQSVHLFEVVERKFVETAKAAVLRRERVVFHPTATRKIIEIVLSHNGGVEVLGLDSRSLLFGACCSHKRDCCKRKNEFFHTFTNVILFKFARKSTHFLARMQIISYLCGNLTPYREFLSELLTNQQI